MSEVISHQLGQVAVEIAVVVRRVEQALAFRPAVRIVEYREAREVGRPAAAEVDVRTLGGILQGPARDVVSDRPEDVP